MNQTRPKPGLILSTQDDRFRYQVLAISVNGKTLFAAQLDSEHGNRKTGILASIPNEIVDWSAGMIRPTAERRIRHYEENEE